MDLHNRPESGSPSSSSHGDLESTPTTGYDPHFSPVVTLLSSLVLLSSILFIVWLHLSVPAVERIPLPSLALSLMVERTMELDAALVGAPAWEQWLYDLTADTGANELAQAIIWYEELAASSNQPLVHLEQVILEGEAGRLERVDVKSRAWEHRSDPFPFFARMVRAAYLEPRLHSEDELALQAKLAEALPAGWFYDRLAIALAERAGDTTLLAATRASLHARAAPLLWRIRVLTAIELVLMLSGIIGLLVVLKAARKDDARFAVGTAPIPPPWRGRIGIEVLLRGGALGLLIALTFVFVDVDDPWIKLSAMPLAGLPLLIMAQRHLFDPAGLGFAEALGLRPVRSVWRRLVAAVLALVAAGLAGEWVLGTLAEQLDWTSHWTEWFDADLVWGERSVLAVGLIEFVIIAPILEEIVFRGLLFGTLRRRFRRGVAIFLSAAIFAGAHGYGALGFGSVFWSGVLWAWMYEKTGSLIPGMLAHALNNLLVCLTMIWLLRASP